MCAVSMIGDHYRDKWQGLPWVNTMPGYSPSPINPYPNYSPNQDPNRAGVVAYSPVSKEDFDKLKAEVMEMKELLKRAIKYDEDNHQPHCEIEEKMDFLRWAAAIAGISLDDLSIKGGQ